MAKMRVPNVGDLLKCKVDLYQSNNGLVKNMIYIVISSKSCYSTANNCSGKHLTKNCSECSIEIEEHTSGKSCRRCSWWCCSPQQFEYYELKKLKKSSKVTRMELLIL